MNEFKGGSISDMLDMLETNKDNLSSVERMSMLRNFAKQETGTIDERRRAQALLRSLSQGRGVKEVRGSVIRGRPAIGRDVMTSDLQTANRPKKNIGFYGHPQETRFDSSLSDRPFKGGLKDSKSKALKYNLGEAFDKDVPNNSTVKITPTDSRRANVYQRQTGGAMQFQTKEVFDGIDYKEGTSYKTKKGNFQPMIDGKFTKARPNPADGLRKPLIDAATSDKPIVRQTGPVARFFRIPGAVPFNSIMMGADIGNWMKDNLDPFGGSSGRGGGRSALND